MDKKELCTDKTVRASGGLSGHFLSKIFKKENMHGKSECMKIMFMVDITFKGSMSTQVSYNLSLDFQLGMGIIVSPLLRVHKQQ